MKKDIFCAAVAVLCCAALMAAETPPLVRLPHRGKGLEGRFHPTYASAHASPHSIYANRDHGGWCIDWSRAGDSVAVERRALVRRLTALRHAHPDLFDAPVIWHRIQDSRGTNHEPPTTKVYAFSRPLPDGTTFTLAVNISREPVTVALPGGRTVTLAPHGFDIADTSN